jgi:predicted RNase H-like HicB family nuclease
MKDRIMIQARFAVQIHKADEGGYWAEVPKLPGCFTQAETLVELRRNLRTAIDLYLEAASPHEAGKPHGR